MRGCLKTFVVHPRGRGILVKQGAAMIPPPEPLRDDSKSWRVHAPALLDVLDD
jgi:hypothetical protein